MTIGPNEVSAASSVANCAILVFAFSIAWYQLRATKHAAELTALMKMGQVFSTPHYIEGRKFIAEKLPALLDDASFVQELHDGALTERVQPLLNFLNEWERVATYVQIGALSEKSVMMAYCSIFRRAWKRTSPAVFALRKNWGPSAYEYFEQVSARAEAWHRKQRQAQVEVPRIATITGEFVERRVRIGDRRNPVGSDRRARV